MIMRKFNGMDAYIPDDLYVGFQTYDEPQYVKKMWERYKDRDTSNMRKMAFDYIQANHSSMRRMQSVLSLIGEL
jgi:hypothetical protein